MNNLVQDELQLEVWQTSIYPDQKSWLLGSESSESSGLAGFPEHPWYSNATGFPVLITSWASLRHPWELDAASGLVFWNVLASSLPGNPTCRLEALSIPGLLDAIGLFADEELVATKLVRFIAVGDDFATILFSYDCSCTPFGVLSVQLIKLKFLAQQVELKWLMLNKWRRLSSHHVWNFLWSKSLRVDVWSQCNGFGSWDPSWSCLTANQKPLCGSLTHVSLLESSLW